MRTDRKMGRVVAIVQARLGSSRLPLKSLLTLGELPVIDWVATRLAAAASLADIVVAVPDTGLDAILVQHLERRGINHFRGPENDVLARFKLAAEAVDADHIVRVCADNPLVWGDAVDQLVRFYAAGNYDYAYNHIPRGNLWPDGLGAEIVSRQLLEELNRKAGTLPQREHCFNYIWDNRDAFRIGTFDPAESWLCRPDIKLDIDTIGDFCRLAQLDVTPLADARRIVCAWDKNFSSK